MEGTFQSQERSRFRMGPGSGKQGFTLIELLVTMLIIAILASVGISGYSMARLSAKESRAKSDIEEIRNALEEYRVEYGAYPQAGAGSITNIVGALQDFSDPEVTDPWGRPYQYACTNRFRYSIRSTGADVTDPADDISPSKAGY